MTVRQMPFVAIESPRCTSDMSRSVWIRKRTSPPTLCRLSTLPRLSIIPVNIFISFSILLPECQLGTDTSGIHTAQSSIMMQLAEELTDRWTWPGMGIGNHNKFQYACTFRLALFADPLTWYILSQQGHPATFQVG